MKMVQRLMIEVEYDPEAIPTKHETLHNPNEWDWKRLTGEQVKVIFYHTPIEREEKKDDG